MNSVTLGSAPTQICSVPLMVDLLLPVMGCSLPAEHGYGLLSALAHLVPSIHQNPHIGILTVAGVGDRQGKIFLTKRSHVRIRLPIETVTSVYGVAGKRLRVGTHEVQLGIPEILTLKSSSSLRARIVTIKGCLEPDVFEQAARTQLERMGIAGQLDLIRDRTSMPIRKVLKIKKYTIVGFSTIVQGLGDEDSIRLQQHGLGGRRRMGCGFFLPCK